VSGGPAELFLAIETATDAPSLALGTAGDTAAVVRVPGRRELSREIERLVQQLLSACGASIPGLAGVIVGDGPGSFTGLRIGIAFAKGLCRACGLPLLAGPSLLGAALGASDGQGTVLVEYDALRGDVYRAVYRFTAGPDGSAMELPAVADRPAPAGRGATIEVLSAPALVSREVPAPAYPGLVRADAGNASAGSLLRLRGFAGGLESISAPDLWEPAYGRLAEAEARRRARER
jgi:tRNA threonylcarbamoyl adenosine modification protein YeaZ